jgi:hypothetical protein
MSGHDRIIDRFVSGSMSRAEEQEFHRLLENDSELRDLYETEQVLNRTMLKDREMLSGVDHSATYARFLAGLAVPAANTAPDPVLESADVRKPWYVPTAARIVIASAVTALLVVGALMLSTSPGNRSINAPSASPVPGASGRYHVRTAAPSSQATAGHATTQTTVPSEQNGSIHAAPAASPALSGPRERAPQSGMSAAPTGTVAARSLPPHSVKPRNAASPTEKSDDWTSSKGSRPPVFSDDSVNVHLNAVQP